MRTVVLTLVLSAGLIASARAGDYLATNFVDVAKTEINGKPARMIFMSSLGTTILMDEGAKRLGLTGTEICEPTQVTAAGQTFSVPIPIFTNPIKQIPWHIRLLAQLTHPILYHQFKNLLEQVSIGLEGVLGWPEVRENILVFDGDRREIRSVEELPPETASWLKLKIVPARCLMMELPLSNGKTNGICIDTGDSRAVIAPPTQWNEWRAAHPQVVLAPHKAIGLPFFITTHYEALADDVKMGPLTLTNVHIADMDGPDAAPQMPNAEAIWVLGVGALARMDLVVDAKNGWAYLHAKAALSSDESRVSASANSSRAADARWKVADNVRLSQDYFYVYAGEFKWNKNDLTNAEADFSRAIEINPSNFEAYSDRGAMKEIRGDFDGAMADYDKVIALEPEYSQNERLYRHTLLWRVETMPNEVADAKPSGADKKDSKSPVELSPVVVYGTPPNGVPGCDKGWAKTIGQFLVGKTDEKDFLSAAKKTGDEGKKARAYYYVGIKHLSKGEKAEARHWFEKCKAANSEDDEYYFASAELKRLEKPNP